MIKLGVLSSAIESFKDNEIVNKLNTKLGESRRELEKLRTDSIKEQKKHLNEVFTIKSLALKTIYDEKDNNFIQTLSTLDKVTGDGIEAFNNYKKNKFHMQSMKSNYDNIKSENKLLEKEIIIIEHEIKEFKRSYEKEDANYDLIQNSKKEFGDYFLEKLKKSLLLSSDIAIKINNKEIELIRKENEKKCSDEKLKMIQECMSKLEEKDFDALSSIKSSLYAGKIYSEKELERKKLEKKHYTEETSSAYIETEILTESNDVLIADIKKD